MRTLHVESVGAGPPLVMLHGFALHGGLFAPVLPALAQRHRVHVVDLAGHGHSQTHAATLEEHANAVIATLSERVTLLGWSFGGQVAMHIARTRPQLVDALVLVCTTPKFVADETWAPAMAATTLAKFGDELRVSYKLTLQRFLTLQVQGSDAGKQTLSTLRQALSARAAPSPQALAEVLRVLATTDLRNDVRDIEARTLVVSGRRDALTPAAAGRWLANAVPNARYVEIEGAAHAPFLSHPAQFARAVNEFLDVHTTSLSRT
jgi:pimeloyl-[acyl-carrier protein] methyl ester esterase